MNGQSIQTNVGSGTVSYAPTNFGSGESQSSVVMTEYGILGNELALLGELTEQLRIKLEPVLGLDMPEPSDGAKNGSPQVSISPFGESIRSDAARARNIGRELNKLLRRIEL